MLSTNAFYLHRRFVRKMNCTSFRATGWGGAVFCISSNRTDDDRAGQGDGGIFQPDGTLLSEFCIVDHWSANLSNAMLTMGPRAVTAHGLPADREKFGLLEFVRCYGEARRAGIIQLFEKAACEATPFHYSSPLDHPTFGPRVVHCFGRHRAVGETAGGGELYGLFLFSRDGFVPL